MGKNNEELNIINYALMKKRTDALDQKIDDAIVGVFTNGGSVAFENLPALSLDKVGWAYQITDDFTTTSDFVEGAGKDYPAGTFVSIANTGTDASPVLKYNAMLGVIIVDTALSTTSKNAVENRVITTDLLTRLQKVSAMPQNPSNNDLVLWQGDSTYTPGHVYKYVVASGDSLYAWHVSNPDGLGNNTIVYTKSLTPTETTLYKANGEPYDAETDDPTFEFVSYDSVTNKITVEILDVNSQETWEKTAGRISIDDRIPTSGWVDVTGYITAGQKDGTALGTKATAEGEDTESSGAYAHAEGLRSEAKGNYSHAEGFEATALGESAHAEGSMTYAEGDFSHAEGAQSEVIGKAAHAENWSYVTGDYSHGEGSSIVYGKYAHGEGSNTLASGDASHAGGIGTKAQRRSQMTMGEYNVVDTDGASELVRGKYVVIIGNGTGDNARSNALTLDWDGNLEVSGDVEDGNGEKISDKADKVTNATSGHLAGLDNNGNLTDSGVSPTEDVTVEGNPVTFESPFEQDAKSVVVSVKPIQDLHGYDHPWVGGAGKNKANIADAQIQTADYIYEDVAINDIGGLNAGTYTISFDVSDFSDGSLSQAILLNSDGTQTESIYISLNNGRCSGVITTNFVATKMTIYSNSPTGCKCENVQIEAGSTATSFAPYSNICPISGIDELEIGVSGKNLFDESSTQNGYFDNSGNLISNAGWKSDYIDVTEGTNYRISGCNEIIGGAYFIWFDSNKNKISIVSEHKNGIYLAPTNAFYLGVSEATGNENISVTTEHTTTIPLPSTLYDADVDVTEGSATEDRTKINCKNLNFGSSTSAGGLHWVDLVSSKTDIEPISDKMEYLNADDGWNSTIPCVSKNSQNEIRIYGSSEVFADGGSYENAEVVYQLISPSTLSFTPTDVELLEGTNVVSTNGEKVAVTYGRSLWQDIDDLKTDTEGKLDKSDVADVEGDTASRPYAVNDFMLRADGLYKVTQPIAQNASITASNTTKTTVGEVLTALLNA